MHKKVYYILFSLLSYQTVLGMNKVELYYARSSDILHACITNNKEQVKMLLENKVSPDTTDSEGKTLLHHACSLGLTDMALLLITQGALCTATTIGYHHTPLHYAVHYGKKDLIKALMLCIQSPPSTINPEYLKQWTVSRHDNHKIAMLCCCLKHNIFKLKIPKPVQNIIINFVLMHCDFSPFLKKLVNTSSSLHHTEYLDQSNNQYDLDTSCIEKNEIGKCTPYELAVKKGEEKIIKILAPYKETVVLNNKKKCNPCIIN